MHISAVERAGLSSLMRGKLSNSSLSRARVRRQRKSKGSALVLPLKLDFKGGFGPPI